ncbi:MAG: hypothetical protein LBB66_00690, partial [Desulfovibrio sp.]|nr:hypothetical protein [Desulfovibrio sp.]
PEFGARVQFARRSFPFGGGVMRVLCVIRLVFLPHPQLAVCLDNFAALDFPLHGPHAFPCQLGYFLRLLFVVKIRFEFVSFNLGYVLLFPRRCVMIVLTHGFLLVCVVSQLTLYIGIAMSYLFTSQKRHLIIQRAKPWERTKIYLTNT